MSTPVDGFVPTRSQPLYEEFIGTQQTMQPSLVSLKSTSTVVLRKEEQVSHQVAELVPAMSFVFGDRLMGLERVIQARLAELETNMLAVSRSSPSEGYTHTNMAAGTSPRPAENRLTTVSKLCEKGSTLSASSCSRSVFCSGSMHRRPCPWASLGHYLRGHLEMFDGLIRLKIVVGYSRRSFLRDSYIYPKFTMRATRRQHARAFKLVNGVSLNLRAAHLRVILRRTLARLRSLFERGKAWPTDIDIDGNSLFMVQATLRYHFNSWNLLLTIS